MHAMVLGFAGYGLLLSSCVSLILLLRIGCVKDILKTPLQILPTSDTVISIITSIILLINQSVMMNDFRKASQISEAKELTNRQLLPEDESEEKYENLTCMGFYYKHNDSWPHEENINGTKSGCTFQHVLMHYAMFLIPFANAFISLLIYSVQCSKGFSCVDKKCKNLGEASRDLRIADNAGQPAAGICDSSFQNKDLVAQEQPNPTVSEDAKADGKAQTTILTIFSRRSNPTSQKNDRKFTGFSLFAQWLVPIIITATLYLSKAQDANKQVNELDEMECIFKINFPLGSCDKSDLANRVEFLSNSEEDYSDSIIGNQDFDTPRISYPDIEAIDKIVSNVRNVVQSALNKTCNNSIKLELNNGSGTWNITNYIATNNSPQGLTSDENEMLKKLTGMQQALDEAGLEIPDNVECTPSDGQELVETEQQTFEQEEELEFFEDVVETTKIETTPSMQDIKPQDFYPQEIWTTAKTATDENNRTVSIEKILEKDLGEAASLLINSENATTRISNEQIYADIIKRIRDTVIQAKTKDKKENSSDNYHGANNGEPSINESDIFLGGSEIERRETRRDGRSSTAKGGKTLSQPQLHMDEDCFLSTKFLKMHLLIFLFLIYFVPVLLSGILQTRAIYMCKNVFERIEAADKRNNEVPRILEENEAKRNRNPAPKVGWFSGVSSNAVSSDSPDSIENEDQNPGGSVQTASKMDFKTREDSLKVEEREKAYKDVLQQTKSMRMMFDILKKSLMLGLLMWTPAFLEILSKVFLCASTPPWLVNILYLLGVSFGFVKNFLNVNIAKINRNMNEQIQGKENSVHPSV